MAFALSRNERLYLQIQTALLTIPNSAGAATVGNSNACRHVRLEASNQVDLIERPDKTGTRTPTSGTAGRKKAVWSIPSMGLAANGTAGTKPDCDPLLEALFGQAATIMSGSATITGATNASPIVITTSVAHGFANGDVVSITGVGGNTNANGIWLIANVAATTFELVGSSGNAAYTSGGTASRVNVKYSLSDSIPSLCLWSFRTPAAIEQRVVFGAVVNEAVFNLGEQAATWNCSGDGIWMLTSKEFANSDSTQKGGLTSFPTEPAAPVTNGALTKGFKGRMVVDGKALANIQTATLRIQTGNAIVTDTFNQEYGDAVEGDERVVTLDISVYDDDAASTDNLKKIANSKAAVEAVLMVGDTVGATWLFHLKGLQIANPTYDDGQRRYKLNMGGSRAHGSSITALDEVRLHIA